MEIRSALQERVYSFIHAHDLILPSSQVVVAVSGGVDSLVLLHLLRSLQDRLNCHLTVATLDHGLRGTDGAADCDYVVSLARSWGVPVTTGRVDVPLLQSEQSLGLEMAARLARYRFLAQVARNVGADRIALGHHLDDQAETILLHLVRGTGLRGLRGMLPQAPHPYDSSLMIIRPLLEIERIELERYCREHQLLPRVDATNADLSLSRNRLRFEILPLLRLLNPYVNRAVARHGAIAAMDEAFLKEQLEHELAIAELSIEAGSVSILRSRLQSWHPALQRRFVIWALEQLGAPDVVTADHVRRAVHVVLHGRQNAIAQFSQGFQLRLDYEYVTFERAGTPILTDAFLLASADSVQVAIPGLTPLGGWALRASLEPLEDHQATIAIPEGMTVELRTRQPGDRFAPRGLGGHSQKLKEWLINHKVPRSTRDRIPLLVMDGQIAAVVRRGAWAISHWAAVRDPRERAVYFRCE